MSRIQEAEQLLHNLHTWITNLSESTVSTEMQLLKIEGYFLRGIADGTETSPPNGSGISGDAGLGNAWMVGSALLPTTFRYTAGEHKVSGVDETPR